jgi:hypothetical protein
MLVLKGENILNAKQKGKVNKSTINACVTKETINKLDKMRIENNASCSEIMRCLIEETDLSKLKFKTISEIYSKARLKKIETNKQNKEKK